MKNIKSLISKVTGLVAGAALVFGLSLQGTAQDAPQAGYTYGPCHLGGLVGDVYSVSCWNFFCVPDGETGDLNCGWNIITDTECQDSTDDGDHTSFWCTSHGNYHICLLSQDPTGCHWNHYFYTCEHIIPEQGSPTEYSEPQSGVLDSVQML